MARRIALTIEYDGTAYAGFQFQANAPSVQGVIEEAASRLTGEHPRLFGAGRTDAGVHSSGQVACFDTTSLLGIERFKPGLNHYLPEDVAVLEAWEAAGDFDPRRQAIARTYRYTVLERGVRSPLRRRSTHQVAHRLDVVAMEEALSALEGERDFAPFCGQLPVGGSTVRFLYRTTVWRQQDDEVRMELEGNAFVHQQVRRIAGAVLGVGLGKMTFRSFLELADSGKHGAATQVLPARGLCLLRVQYGDLSLARSSAASTNEMMVG